MANDVQSTPIKGEPLPILRFIDGKAQFNTENLGRVLNKAGNRKIATVSINGPARTGKSYLLSNFVRFIVNNGGDTANGVTDWFHRTTSPEERFRWKGGTSRTTTGIDIWSEPLSSTVDDESIAILLIDTQGSFDQETSMQDNCIVFAASIMLSSVFIYNCRKWLPESDLQFLHFFTDFAQKVNPDDGCLGRNLVFIVRDFQDTVDYAYGYHGKDSCPKDTKNYFLRKVMDNDTQNEEVQTTHAAIVNAFENVGCFLMPEPSKQLKRSDDESNMDPDFLSYLDQFIRTILAKDQLQLKKVSGSPVSAEAFLEFVERWADCIDGELMPAVSTICAMITAAQREVGSLEALKVYNKSMQQLLRQMRHLPMSQLKIKHDQFVEDAISSYTKLIQPYASASDEKGTIMELRKEMERTMTGIQNQSDLTTLDFENSQLQKLEQVSKKYERSILDANSILGQQKKSRSCVIVFVNRTELTIQVPELTLNCGRVKQEVKIIQPYDCVLVEGVKRGRDVFGVEGMYGLVIPALKATVLFMFAVPMFRKNRFAVSIFNTEAGYVYKNFGLSHFLAMYHNKEDNSDGTPSREIGLYDQRVRKMVRKGQTAVGIVEAGDFKVKITMVSSKKSLFTVEFSNRFPSIFAGGLQPAAGDGEHVSDDSSSEGEPETVKYEKNPTKPAKKSVAKMSKDELIPTRQSSLPREDTEEVRELESTGEKPVPKPRTLKTTLSRDQE